MREITLIYYDNKIKIFATDKVIGIYYYDFRLDKSSQLVYYTGVRRKDMLNSITNDGYKIIGMARLLRLILFYYH